MQDISFYHPTDSLLDAFTRLADPSRCGARLAVDNLHDAEDVSFGLRVATFSTAAFATAGEKPQVVRPHVLLNFGAHGRELITSEVGLRLASMLCGEAPSRFVDGDIERSRVRITELLQRVVVKVVPVQVPSARRRAEVGEGSCTQRRLNGRGVDVNRNWDVAWGDGDKAEGSSQYRGPRPFSEPETRALARLATDWRPDVFVDVRSGDRFLAMPYAHRAASPSNREERAAMLDGLRAVTSMFARAHPRLLAYGSVPAGPAASLGEEPYRATGTALDYMYTKAGVRLAYMLDVFGASTVFGLGARKQLGIGRLPSSASVVNLLQLHSDNASAHNATARNATARNATARNATATAGASSHRQPVLHMREWRRRGDRHGALVPQPSPLESAQTGALTEMEEVAETRQRRRRRHARSWRAGRSLSFTSLAEGLHPASTIKVQAAAVLEREERAEARHQRHRTPRSEQDDEPDAGEEHYHGMPQPALLKPPSQHGRAESVVRILHLSRPRPPQRPRPTSFVSLEEGPARSGGLSARPHLQSEERPFDCVAFFNPTSFAEFEETVNAWADALLVLINSSITSFEQAARRD